MAVNAGKSNRKEQDYKARLNRAKASSARMARGTSNNRKNVKGGAGGFASTQPFGTKREESGVAGRTMDSMSSMTAQAQLALARRPGVDEEEEEERESGLQEATDRIKNKIKDQVKKKVKKVVKKAAKRIAMQAVKYIIMWLGAFFGSTAGLFIIGIVIILILATATYFVANDVFRSIFNPESVPGACPHGICPAN